MEEGRGGTVWSRVVKHPSSVRVKGLGNPHGKIYRHTVIYVHSHIYPHICRLTHSIHIHTPKDPQYVLQNTDMNMNATEAKIWKGGDTQELKKTQPSIKSHAPPHSLSIYHSFFLCNTHIQRHIVFEQPFQHCWIIVWQTRHFSTGLCCELH